MGSVFLFLLGCDRAPHKAKLLKFPFFLLVLYLNAAPLRAHESTATCYRLVVDPSGGRRGEKEFWKTHKKITVMTPSGKKPFAFGFDAELWRLSDVLALINSDPKARIELAKVLEENPELQMTRAAMKKILGCESEDELNSYLYAKKRAAKLLTFSDVKPSYLKELFHKEKEKTRFAEALVPLVTMALNNRGIPVDAKHEPSSGDTTQGPLGAGEAVELIQQGAISDPLKFHDLIKKFLYTETDYPETHFHVSVPVEAVTWQQMLLIARAVETKITLEELLEVDEYEGTLHPYDDSALAVEITPEPYIDESMWTLVDRGVVRVEMNRWQTPVRANDVEIRMWLDADQAFASMQMLMKLVQNAGKLRDTSAFTGKRVPNIGPANLNGSLRYAAFVLKDRLPKKKAHVIAKLNEFADAIESSMKLNAVLRGKICRFVSKENILKYLSIETFLNPE